MKLPNSRIFVNLVKGNFAVLCVRPKRGLAFAHFRSQNRRFCVRRWAKVAKRCNASFTPCSAPGTKFRTLSLRSLRTPLWGVTGTEFRQPPKGTLLLTKSSILCAKVTAKRKCAQYVREQFSTLSCARTTWTAFSLLFESPTPEMVYRCL